MAAVEVCKRFHGADFCSCQSDSNWAREVSGWEVVELPNREEMLMKFWVGNEGQLFRVGQIAESAHLPLVFD